MFLQTAACDELVELMKLYPETTKFLLNTWTWGYEELIKAVASGFNTKVCCYVCVNPDDLGQ